MASLCPTAAVGDGATRGVSDRLASGEYARKQIYCPSRVVAWSHRSRFRLAARLATGGAGGRLLDYGCGDGTFMLLTLGMFAEAVGADLDSAEFAECRRRLGGLPGLTFLRTADLVGPRQRRTYDVVTCMEVLEHCVDAERVRVLEHLHGLVAARGRVVISVPIEIGPALAGKQLFRALAAWQGQGDYRHRETYSPRELMNATFGRPGLARARYELRTASGPMAACGHKGFDWRILQKEIMARFAVERRLFTPLGRLGPLLNSQVWFVCVPR